MPLPCGISLPHAKARVLALMQHYCDRSPAHHRPHVSLSEALPQPLLLVGSLTTRHAVGTCSPRWVRGRVALRRSQLPFFASVGRCFPPGFCGSASRSVDATVGAVSCALLAPACQPLTLGHIHDGSSHLCWRCP